MAKWSVSGRPEEAADSLAPLEAPELVRLPDPVLGGHVAGLVRVINVQAVAGLEFLDRLDVSSCGIRRSNSAALMSRLRDSPKICSAAKQVSCFLIAWVKINPALRYAEVGQKIEVSAA